MAKVIDDAPVLIFTFAVHQTVCVRDKMGSIKEGSEVCCASSCCACSDVMFLSSSFSPFHSFLFPLFIFHFDFFVLSFSPSFSSSSSYIVG